jgi:hypothetical protein
MSGGFPHSEISGSKPIPGSPKLNAGYHVLHRLLLPRHPPNALFALDLTRKEQGRWFTTGPSQCQKSYTYPCVQRTRQKAQSPHTVSVLDLEQYRPTQPNTRMQHVSGPMTPYSGPPGDTDVSLSKRCQFSCPSSSRVTWAFHPLQDDQTRPKTRLMIMQDNSQGNGGSRRT